ncbi:hypothetical protein HDU97_005266, partial [Phlyctochytrium planicorne]
KAALEAVNTAVQDAQDKQAPEANKHRLASPFQVGDRLTGQPKGFKDYIQPFRF